MSISLKTHKMLWGRAANRCALPECRRELVMDASETDDESLIGEECHIVAREQNGPRGDSPLAPEARDKHDNLILLCSIHHKLIDDQPNTYGVQMLKEMKALHEKWVRESLQDFDPVRQSDDELYATYIEEWMRYVDVEHWDSWTSSVLSFGQPRLSVSHEEQLNILSEWMLSRIWPTRYPELEEAFDNFHFIVQDFLQVFHQHSDRRDDRYQTTTFYKARMVEQDTYDRLLKAYNFHVDLVQDLMLELTRAANYICDRIRQFIDPTFRLKEGVILVSYGPTSSFSFKLIRTEYYGSERTLRPYPGLKQFKLERKNRNVHFGTAEGAERPY